VVSRLPTTHILFTYNIKALTHSSSYRMLRLVHHKSRAGSLLISCSPVTTDHTRHTHTHTHAHTRVQFRASNAEGTESPYPCGKSSGGRVHIQRTALDREECRAVSGWCMQGPGLRVHGRQDSVLLFVGWLCSVVE
jgi:hypothetical protein